MFIEAPEEGISSCPSTGTKDEPIERTYDYFTGSRSLQGKTKKMEVVDDFESRPHKAVTFLVERDKEIQEVPSAKSLTRIHWCYQVEVVQKVGKGGREEEDKMRRVEKEVMNAVWTANLVDSTISGVLAGEVDEEKGDVDRGPNSVFGRGGFSTCVSKL